MVAYFNKGEVYYFGGITSLRVRRRPKYTTHFNKAANHHSGHGVPRQTGETVSSEKGPWQQLAESTAFFDIRKSFLQNSVV